MPSLFDAPPVHELARAHDPETSKQSAVGAQDQIIKDHERLILEALTKGPIEGLTAKEIARFVYATRCIALSSVQVSRRIASMRERRLIVTLDGLGNDPKVMEPGHSTHAEARDRCFVQVLAEHHQAAVVVYRQRGAAERIVA